eukprot:13658390-Alexandrium_andersonii.AAC.1
MSASLVGSEMCIRDRALVRARCAPLCSDDSEARTHRPNSAGEKVGTRCCWHRRSRPARQGSSRQDVRWAG